MESGSIFFVREVDGFTHEYIYKYDDGLDLDKYSAWLLKSIEEGDVIREKVNKENENESEVIEVTL